MNEDEFVDGIQTVDVVTLDIPVSWQRACINSLTF